MSIPLPERAPLVLSVDSVVYQVVAGAPPKLIVSVVGTVDSGGWQAGELIPRIYLDYPKDGVQEFDFIAGPPRRVSDPVPCPIFSEVVIEFENWMRGFRIHSASNQYDVRF
jgi:hypothetical protein